MHNRLGHRFQRRIDVPVWIEPKTQGGDAYSDKVLTFSPLRYWPLWDVAGPNAEELVVGDDGTYNNVTLGETGIGDGRTSVLFDTNTDFVNIFSAALAAAFSGLEGSMMIWARVTNAGIWTDGLEHRNLVFREAAVEYSFMQKGSINNDINPQYRAGGIFDQVVSGGHSTTDWMNWILTWSDTADELKIYVDTVVTTTVGIGTWAGVGNIDAAFIGNWNGASIAWAGWLAHAAVWDVVLTQADVDSLATV